MPKKSQLDPFYTETRRPPDTIVSVTWASQQAKPVATGARQMVLL